MSKRMLVKGGIMRGRGFQEVTYKPLGGGKFKSSTGEIVHDTKRHRWMFLRNKYPPHPQVEISVKPQKMNFPLPKAVIMGFGMNRAAYCPFCYLKVVYIMQQVTCTACGKSFIVEM